MPKHCLSSVVLLRLKHLLLLKQTTINSDHD
jgi:hypothetical protein